LQNKNQDDCLTIEEGYTRDYVKKHIENWKKYLAKYINKENLNFLEIGTYEGKSAVWFLENILTHPTSRITCIDGWWSETFFKRFSYNIKNYVEKTNIVRSFSSNALRKYEPVPTFDVIYIDGGHRAPTVLEDMVLSFPLLKPGGLFLLDDYRLDPHLPAHERPQLAIDSFIEIYTGKIEVVFKEYQVYIKKNVK
jgi:predicted O-methyltransferase YrrM